GRIRLAADSFNPQTPAVSSIDFGDDSSTWANDGECDDPRFQGDGMASTTVAADIRRDASDCRSLFQQGSIQLLANTGAGNVSAAGIEFGDDSSNWANDGECDDPRFEGDGMAFSTSETDIRRDASDCRSLFQQGSISLISSDANSASLVDSSGIDFGDDSGNWALDGECDDPRFSGDGMAISLQDSNIRRDASDCRALFQTGSIQLVSNSPNLAASNSGLIDFGDNSSNWANDGECDDPRFEGDGMANVTLAEDTRRDANDCRSLFERGSIRLTASNQQQLQALLSGNASSGTLTSGDAQGINGGYADNYSFEATAGESAIIDLRSDDFDTYLRVTSPSGQILSNDDFQASTSRSVVNIPSTEAGQYQVEVTSFGSSESGAYSLQMNTSAATGQVAQQSYNGRLENGDLTLQSGEYRDSYSFEGSPGQRVSIDLRSDEFDTYVILVSPSGEQEENDDANGTNSQLVIDLTEQGSYQVWVTSFSEGETGSYQLEIANGDSSGIAASVSADVNNLSVGESVTGNLSSTDSRAVTDGPEDAFVFYGEAGESVIIDLESGEFDTYLTLITPDGERIENDDFQSSLQQSQVSLSLPQTGRYRVIASSYGGQGLGDYLLSVRAGSSGSSIPGGVLAGGSGGQIYGLFVGVADYPGTDSDLPLTDQDAQRARDALIQGAGMNPGNATTLLNSDATRANFSNALDRIAATADSDDTLVIFYSGHGSRLPRSSGYDSRDPDGYDETMVLYDENLLDDELAAMLDAMDVGKVLLVMDSCFSGGFAKDIVSRPGRMGMFSSEEDVLSQVAMKFQAGGYLSYFFEEALTQRYADRDNNGEITAIELSQYLHQRFDTDVKSFGTDDYVRAQGPQASYQKLVIDRGGIG
ncbi:MAG: caspase family protein, partial [Pseudomonadales bacterium]|nr:caspase family protein [Pseudomonadales bacterium]